MNKYHSNSEAYSQSILEYSISIHENIGTEGFSKKEIMDFFNELAEFSGGEALVKLMKISVDASSNRYMRMPH